MKSPRPSPGTIRNDQNAARVAHGSSPPNHLVAARVAGKPISNGTPPKIQHRCRRHHLRHHSARSTAVERQSARGSLRESSSQEVVQQQPRSPAGEIRIIGREKRAGGRPQLMVAGFILLLHRAWIARRQHCAFNDVVYCFYRLMLSNSFSAARQSEDAMRCMPYCCAVSRRGNPSSARKCATSGCLIRRSASVGRLRIGASSCPR
jgi:hypothetical protein